MGFVIVSFILIRARPRQPPRRHVIVESGNDIMYAINIPQESVTIPETMDAIRASMKMQLTREEGTAETNKYLGIGRFKK